MSIKTLERYIQKCRKNNIFPTLRGAEKYKIIGVV